MIHDMLYEAAWHARISRVFSGALRIWGVSGTVRRDPDDANGFVIAASTASEIRIRHHTAAGWTMTRRDTVLGAQVPLDRHAGLPGVLRRLRDELAPDAPAGRLVISAQKLERDFGAR
jgi:hypothetical protein